MHSMRRIYAVIPLLLVGIIIASGALASAASANISHPYRGSKDIMPGNLVSLDSKQDNFVEPANLNTENRLVGIAVGDNDSLVAIDADSNRIQIATSGEATALVSDLNGSIRSGDQIAVSPFSGIGMKAQPGSRIIGLAQSALSGDAARITTKEVTDRDGKKKTIKVGYIRVSIAIGSVPNVQDEGQRNAIQRLARSLTGRDVSAVRLVISTFIAVIALVALVTLVYTSVYGTIIAIGRNPLAKASIFRALISVIGLVILTAGVALGAIYLIIR